MSNFKRSMKRKQMVDLNGKPLLGKSVTQNLPTAASMLDSIKLVHEISGQEGNWNHNPVNMGMYNMAELILAGIEERQPEFKSKPIEGFIEKTSENEIEKLAEFIMDKFPYEPGKGGTNESAVDVAIRLLDQK